MRTIINKTKFWYWWFFKATAMDKLNWDLCVRGMAIRKMRDEQLDNAKRVNPKQFFIDPN